MANKLVLKVCFPSCKRCFFSNCTVENAQYALKGQNLLAQGIALGITMNDTNALQGQKHYTQ